jgi:hypothetical protein
MADLIALVQENFGWVWVGLGVAWGAVMAVALLQAWGGSRVKKEAFGKEVFATTRDVRRYGLLEEPRDARDW